MIVASSMAELEKLIMDEIYAAMSVARSKSEQDTKIEVQSFYSQGSPTIYKRTEILETVYGQMEQVVVGGQLSSLYG